MADGYCQCGCGQKTALARQSSTALGWVKGKPIRYVNGHQGRATYRAPLATRLWSKVDKRGPDDCWPFTGATARGYGRIGVGYEVENAHRVALRLTDGPPPGGGMQARHLCGNRLCCNPAHLAWGTQSDNEMDKVAHGLSNRGVRHGMAKLTAEQVREIRQRHAAGETQSQLAGAFDISQTTIWEIASGRTWSWLKGGDALCLNDPR